MMRETSEKENQNVYTRKEKEKERRRRRVNSAAAAGCVFCLSYPIFLIGNWPFFLPFCSSTVLRVSVTFNASASCVYRRVCGCTRHSFFILRRTKRKHKFQFWIHNVFSMLEEIVSWLLPSSGYFFFSARQSIRLHPNRVMVRLQLQPSCPLVCSHTIALLSFFSWIWNCNGPASPMIQTCQSYNIRRENKSHRSPSSCTFSCCSSSLLCTILFSLNKKVKKKKKYKIKKKGKWPPEAAKA